MYFLQGMEIWYLIGLWYYFIFGFFIFVQYVLGLFFVIDIFVSNNILYNLGDLESLNGEDVNGLLEEG